jgi:hypothetical protein
MMLSGMYPACDVSETDAGSGMRTNLGESVVPFGGNAESSMGDSFFTSSSRTIVNAESGVCSLHLADSGFTAAGLAAEATETSVELYGVGLVALGRCASEDDYSRR